MRLFNLKVLFCKTTDLSDTKFKSKYPFPRMRVGDHEVVKGAKIHTVRASAWAHEKKMNAVFSVRPLDNNAVLIRRVK
jgi:hypothetical protein